MFHHPGTELPIPSRLDPAPLLLRSLSSLSPDPLLFRVDPIATRCAKARLHRSRAPPFLITKDAVKMHAGVACTCADRSFASPSPRAPSTLSAGDREPFAVDSSPASAPPFKGSSLKVIGDFSAEEGEWAIVGGTGEFAFAQGVITFKMAQMAQGNVWELNVHALCLTFSKPSKGENCGDKTDVPNDKPCVQNLVAKVGLFGNAEKKILDITETPQRLESVTIRSGDVVDSLVFSYVDQAGQKHTTERWGGPRGLESNKIELAPSEFVKEISGTTRTYGRGKVVGSLTFVTNVRTYGPFGKAQSAGTPFSVPVQDNCSIVGFFACAGDYIEAIGVYVRANGPN